MKAFKLYFSMICLLSVFTFAATSCGDDDESGLQQFTVTFDSQGGSSVASQKVDEGAKVQQPVAPTKENFAFMGWYKEAACTHLWDFNRDVVTNDITLYAGWKTADYTVTFETNGGSVVEPQGVVDGGLLNKPASPTKEGFAFGGWYTDAELTHPYDFDTPVTGDFTLYAKWTEITMETLQQLITEAEQLREVNYEEESFDAMVEKLNTALSVVYDGNATPEEIATAYQELAEAINNLVALPHRPTVEIGVRPTPSEDEVILVASASEVAIYAMGLDANGEESTQSEVTFEYNLEDLADPAIKIWEYEYGMGFTLKSDVALGSTAKITIKSAENPEITRTITLRVASEEDLVQQFIDATLLLPAPADMTLEKYDEILNKLQQVGSLYEQCVSLPGATGITFQAAVDKMRECQEAFEEFMKFAYSFNGNRCTFSDVIGGYVVSCAYEPNGAFPAGTYTSDWEEYESNFYGQTRIIFNANGTLYSEFRGSSNPDGSNPSAWEKDGEGEYIYTGSKEQGGYFTMKINYDEEVVLPEEPSAMMKVFRSRK